MAGPEEISALRFETCVDQGWAEDLVQFLALSVVSMTARPANCPAYCLQRLLLFAANCPYLQRIKWTIEVMNLECRY